MNFIFLLTFMILQEKIHFVLKVIFFSFLYNILVNSWLNKNGKATQGVNQTKYSQNAFRKKMVLCAACDASPVLTWDVSMPQ